MLSIRHTSVSNAKATLPSITRYLDLDTLGLGRTGSTSRSGSFFLGIAFRDFCLHPILLRRRLLWQMTCHHPELDGHSEHSTKWCMIALQDHRPDVACDSARNDCTALYGEW